jgi:hypothetical protein
LNNLTRFFLSTRQSLPEALELSRRLVKVDPNAANYDLLAWACYANGQTNAARAASAESVNKDPNNRAYRERLRRLQEVP